MILTCRQCHQKNRVRAADVTKTARCGACRTDLLPIARPLDADPALFDEVLRDSPVPVLVDFWAAWCGPCRMAAPEVARVAEAASGRALVLKVDTEAHPDIAARYHVQGIPNFLVTSGGRVVMQQAGVVPAGTMLRWIEQAARPERADT